jgi:hypothetical protein
VLTEGFGKGLFLEKIALYRFGIPNPNLNAPAQITEIYCYGDAASGMPSLWMINGSRVAPA